MKLYKSSLTTADSLISSVLDNEATNIKSLIDNINYFILEKETFTGDSWDLHRKIFTKYIDILSTKADMAHELASAMRSANQIMSDFLGGDDYFEDTYYDDAINGISQLSLNQDNLSSSDVTTVIPNETAVGLSKLGYEAAGSYNFYISRCDKFRTSDATAFAKLSATDSLFTAASQESYDV